jgi:hypothetical protein
MNGTFSYDEDHTGCGSCGDCLFSITSSWVKDVSLGEILSRIWYTQFVYQHCVQYAPTVKCSLEHTRVDCTGRVRLGLVRVSDRTIAKVVRDLYGRYYDASKAHEYRERHFVEVPRGERYTPISAEEVFVRLIRSWHTHRKRYRSEVYREELSKSTIARLCEVEAGKLPLIRCSIDTVSRALVKV